MAIVSNNEVIHTCHIDHYGYIGYMNTANIISTFRLEGFLDNSTLSRTILGNTFGDYIVASAIFIVTIIIIQLFRNIILGRLGHIADKTDTTLDDFFVSALQAISAYFYVYVSLYFALQFLAVGTALQNALNVILIILAIFEINRMIDAGMNGIANDKNGKTGHGTLQALSGMNKVFSVLVWIIGFLFLLSNIGVNISSLIAGLGIGGVAVALALQNILGDLFSYFAIHFDRPFATGDFIIVGDKMGVVDKIGLKTTRLHALQGEEIIVSNRELTSTQIQNFKKMRERRVVFAVSVTYDTEPEKLKAIPNIIRDIIDSEKSARFDRSHFASFGDSALNFETVYYVKNGDYNGYMDVNQSILLKIARSFRNENIQFAFPTRTIHLQKS